MKTRHSQPFLWIVFILGILMFAFVYLVVSKPISIVYNDVYNDSYLMHEDYQNFFIRSVTIWRWLPFIAVLSTILWVLIKVHESYVQGGMI